MAPHFRLLSIALLILLLGPPIAVHAASPTPSPQSPIPKYTLRYRFQPGETVRWDVLLRKRIQVSFGGSTKNSDIIDRSTKCWRVVEVDPAGNAVFETRREDLDMRQQMTGQKPVHYNSKTDKTPPPGFEDAARRIGKPLTRIKLDNRGRIVERTPLLPEPASRETPELTIPLPKRAIAVGESWRRRHTVLLPLENGATKSILIQQVFTLSSVKTGVATIEVANQVLTPVYSPEIEAKLIERYAHGTVRFDVDAGRVISLQMDLDRQVIGFRGADSCLHYRTRSTEQLLSEVPNVAARPNAPKQK